MNIGILGAGSVGTALALAWRSAGHRVQVGVRDAGSGAKPGQEGIAPLRVPLERAAGNEVVVLATPWTATIPLLRTLDLSGRIIIDATNPVTVRGGALLREPTEQASAAEDVAAAAPGASVFKSLNQAGANILGGAKALGFRPLMFTAGDDAANKAVVRSLVADIGFDARDAGPLASAAYLEGLAWLWIHEALTGAGRDFAFASVPTHQK